MISENQNADYRMLENIIGYTFKDKELLIQALTHRSFTNENHLTKHNERLEFLGDAILQYVSTTNLYNLYPEENEGVLSMYRSLLVKTGFLIEVANKLDIRVYMRVSAGQKREVENMNLSIFADAIEALIGAIYVDGGIDSVRGFIEKHILNDIENYLSGAPLQDPKTRFQEIVQQSIQVTPTYVVLKETGPDHNKEFTVAVKVNDSVLGRATGKSKRDAEKNAAEDALFMWRVISDNETVYKKNGVYYTDVP